MDLPVTNGVVTLLPPPAGYVVDFENPQRNGDVTCYVLTGVGSFLALLFLGQRLYVKGIVRKHLTFDDGVFCKVNASVPLLMPPGLLIVAWVSSCHSAYDRF